MIKLTNILSEIRVIGGRKIYLTEKGKKYVKAYNDMVFGCNLFKMERELDDMYDTKSKEFSKAVNLSIWVDERLLDPNNPLPKEILIKKFEKFFGDNDEAEVLEEYIKDGLLEEK